MNLENLYFLYNGFGIDGKKHLSTNILWKYFQTIKLLGNLINELRAIQLKMNTTRMYQKIIRWDKHSKLIEGAKH